MVDVCIGATVGWPACGQLPPSPWASRLVRFRCDARPSADTDAECALRCVQLPCDRRTASAHNRTAGTMPENNVSARKDDRHPSLRRGRTPRDTGRVRIPLKVGAQCPNPAIHPRWSVSSHRRSRTSKSRHGHDRESREHSPNGESKHAYRLRRDLIVVDTVRPRPRVGLLGCQ